MEFKVKEPLRWQWRKLLKYFIQGLIVLAPIIITVWAIVSLFLFVDNILPRLLQPLYPSLFTVDSGGHYKTFPGLGFLVLIIFIVLIGWISTSYLVGKAVEFLDHILERTPGIRLIYSSVKDFLEAFAGEKRKFDKPVLVSVDASDVWRMGFITQKSGTRFGLDRHVVVYVPHSYAVSGIVYLVPAEKVRPLNDMSSTDAMKFVLSGGVAHVS